MNIQSKLLIENNALIDAEIYPYNQTVIYQDWLLVPVSLEKRLYSIYCFTPGGYSCLKTPPYSSIKEALLAGKELVRRETIDVILALPFIFNVL